MIEIVRWLGLGIAVLLGSASMQAPSQAVPAAAQARAGYERASSERLAQLADRVAEQHVAQVVAQLSQRPPALTAGSVLRPAAAAARGPVPQPPGSGGGACDPSCVQNLIRQAFAPYGQTGIDWGLRVGKCESNYHETSVNPAGPYYGVFQFLLSTFRATPYGNQDPLKAQPNVYAAAWKYGMGGAGAWGCK